MTLLLEENELKEKNVLIIESFYFQVNDSDENNLQETLVFSNDVKFELRVISYTKEIEGNDYNFEAGVYARHGNHHKSWWFQDRSHHLRLQIDKSENIASKLSHQQPYTLLYCRVDKSDVESLRDEYLSYLGGQKTFKCNNHKLSLVRSYQKKLKCNLCNENPEYYCCPRFDCNCSICINCYNSSNNSDDYIYVTPHNQENDNDVDSTHSNSDDDDDEDVSSCDNSKDTDSLIDFFLNG